jgi:hypothetical protein
VTDAKPKAVVPTASVLDFFHEPSYLKICIILLLLHCS